ncbi:MAG: aldolase [Acidobacteria bacterium]|nr:aldolase [Acidobacteriota bacterium]
MLTRALATILLLLPLPAAWGQAKVNRVINLWKEGIPAIGHGVVDFSFDQATQWSRSEYDFLFVDHEHRPLNFGELRFFLQALLDRGQILTQGDRLMKPVPFLRIPGEGRESNTWMIKQALDIGAPAVIVPRVSTAAQALNAVRGARYPQTPSSRHPKPDGFRGASPDIAVRYWGVTMPEYFRMADTWPLNPEGEVILTIQIEDREGMANLDEILKVPGIGMVLIGPLDLSFALGHPGDRDHPEVEAGIQQIFRKVKAAGISCGIVTAANRALERARQGFKWISVGGELDPAVIRQARQEGKGK